MIQANRLTFRVLLASVMCTPVLLAQTGGNAVQANHLEKLPPLHAQAGNAAAAAGGEQTSADMQPHIYELHFTAKELDGKRLINTREYKTYVTMQGTERGFATIRSGTKIPLTTGSNKEGGVTQSTVSYVDIGINIDVRDARVLGGKLATKIVAEISSVADASNKADPVISQRKWEGSVILVPDRVIPIFSSDDVESKHTFQLDVVAREMP